MIIYASNIHVTGGKVLLEDLLRSIEGSCVLFAHTKFVLDSDLEKRMRVIRVKPSFIHRFLAEFELKRLAKNHDEVLCFGNLPPLFRLEAKCFLYFQNTILFKKRVHLKFPLKVKAKHIVERLWLKWGIKNVDRVYVQSQSVQESFEGEFPASKVLIAPFMAPIQVVRSETSPKFDFVYVSSADPHKNLLRLLGAWKRLGEEGLFPSLALTFTTAPQALLTELAELQSSGLKITNLTEKSRQHVLDIYASSRALIFPSLTESFGMPLVEASAYGLPILAGELDYVREFVTPAQTFDPYSERSIYRAVKRFLLGNSAEDHQPVYSPSEFIRMLKV